MNPDVVDVVLHQPGVKHSKRRYWVVSPSTSRLEWQTVPVVAVIHKFRDIPGVSKLKELRGLTRGIAR